MMHFTADESLEGTLVERLRADGHPVDYVAETTAGDPDPRVLAAAVRADTVLVTNDTDFGELVFKDGLPSPGVLLLRFPKVSAAAKETIVMAFIAARAAELPGRFCVLNVAGPRFREPPESPGDDPPAAPD